MVRNYSINFFWHLPVKASQTCFHMEKGNVLIKSKLSGRKSGTGITLSDNCIDGDIVFPEQCIQLIKLQQQQSIEMRQAIIISVDRKFIINIDIEIGNILFHNNTVLCRVDNKNAVSLVSALKFADDGR